MPEDRGHTPEGDRPLNSAEILVKHMGWGESSKREAAVAALLARPMTGETQDVVYGSGEPSFLPEIRSSFDRKTAVEIFGAIVSNSHPGRVNLRRKAVEELARLLPQSERILAAVFLTDVNPSVRSTAGRVLADFDGVISAAAITAANLCEWDRWRSYGVPSPANHTRMEILSRPLLDQRASLTQWAEDVHAANLVAHAQTFMCEFAMITKCRQREWQRLLRMATVVGLDSSGFDRLQRPDDERGLIPALASAVRMSQARTADEFIDRLVHDLEFAPLLDSLPLQLFIEKKYADYEDALVSLLDAPQPRLQAFGALAMGRLGLRHLEALGSLLLSEEAYVRRAAALSLLELGGKAAMETVAYFRNDNDEVVSRLASRARLVVSESAVVGWRHSLRDDPLNVSVERKRKLSALMANVSTPWMRRARNGSLKNLSVLYRSREYRAAMGYGFNQSLTADEKEYVRRILDRIDVAVYRTCQGRDDWDDAIGWAGYQAGQLGFHHSRNYWDL